MTMSVEHPPQLRDRHLHASIADSERRLWVRAHLVVEATTDMGPEPGAVRKVSRGSHLGGSPPTCHLAGSGVSLQELHLTHHVCNLQEVGHVNVRVQCTFDYR